MVWLFPVPGGPMSTKSLPLAAAITAESWDESAGSGQKVCCGVYSASNRLGFGKLTCDAKASRGVSIKWRTTAFSRNWSVRSAKSFHIRYLANENADRTTSSDTSHPGMSRMAFETVFQMAEMSSPASSRASSPSVTPRFNRKSCRSISIKVGLNLGSSSCMASVKPARTLLRFNVTGSRMSGARCF